MSIRAKVNLDLSQLGPARTLPKAKNITMKAVKAGAKLVQAQAKARAPKASGALKQSMGIKTVRGRGLTMAIAVIGARKKVEKMVKRGRSKKLVKAVPANYAHLVNKGTKPHSIKLGARLSRKGKPAVGQEVVHHPGAKANPFLDEAYRSTASQAIAAGNKVLADEAAKIITKG